MIRDDAPLHNRDHQHCSLSLVVKLGNTNFQLGRVQDQPTSSAMLRKMIIWKVTQPGNLTIKTWGMWIEQNQFSFLFCWLVKQICGRSAIHTGPLGEAPPGKSHHFTSWRQFIRSRVDHQRQWALLMVCIAQRCLVTTLMRSTSDEMVLYTLIRINTCYMCNLSDVK